MKTKLLVWAECHSDDHLYEAEFDAAPWLKKATTKEIADLAVCGWGGDYPADEVAMAMAGKVEDIKDMFKYIERKNRGVADHIGFECHVSEDQALAWLKANRPKVYAAALKASKEE